MKVNFKQGVTAENLLSPDDALWQSLPKEKFNLDGTFLGMQPSAFVQAKWKDKEIGITSNVSVRAVHNGEWLAFHLSWKDETQDIDHGDNTSFPDAAAIAFPLHENSPIMTMGAPGMGLNAWYWRADAAAGRQVLLEGPGSSQVVDSEHVKTKGSWVDGVWSVVIARPLKIEGAESVAQLVPGDKTKFGVAVWEGNRGERGGIKAFSPDWIELTLAEQ